MTTSRWHLPLLFLLAGFFFLVRLDCPLLEPEEVRYAEIPRQMLHEQAFVVPVLHHQPYLHKPPLLYWLVMTVYAFLGSHDWAARLIPGFCGIAIVLLGYLMLRRPLGANGACLGALVLCLSPRFIYLERMLTLDCLLCLWVVLSWLAGYRALILPSTLGGEGLSFFLPSPRTRGEGLGVRGCWAEITAEVSSGHSGLPLTPNPSPQSTGARGEGKPTILPEVSGQVEKEPWRWWLLSALACGLGLLTKGPVALALILPPLLGFQLFNRRFSARHWLVWLGVALAVALPWYAALACLDFPALVEFLWLHNAVRYVAPFDHVKPFWFYLPPLLIGMLPWSLLLWPLGRSLLARSAHPPALWFLLLASGWSLLFFSLAGCKRAVYILPVLPPLAFALGCYLDRSFAWRPWRAWYLGGVLAWAVLLAVGVTFLLPEYHRRFSLRQQVSPQQVLASEMPVVCYPKRWDSIGFYLGRDDVRVFERDELPELLAFLRERSQSLVFVKGEHLAELLAALPAELEFVPQMDASQRLRVGIVRWVPSHGGS